MYTICGRLNWLHSVIAFLKPVEFKGITIGRGILKSETVCFRSSMVVGKKEMEDYRLPFPVIKADRNWFKIIFLRPDLQKQSYEDRVNGAKTGTYTGTKGKAGEILRIIIDNPYLSAEEIGKTIGLTRRGVRYHLDILKAKNKEFFLRKH